MGVKKLVENFSYYEMTQTNHFCMKEYSALHKLYNTINYTSQATQWNRFYSCSHITNFFMQKVASVAFIPVLKVHNFIIYHPNSK